MVKFSKLLEIIVNGIIRKISYTLFVILTIFLKNYLDNLLKKKKIYTDFLEKFPWQSSKIKDTYTDPVTKQLYPKNDYNREIFVTDPFENKFLPANSSFQSTQNSLRFLNSPLIFSENLDKIFLSILKFIIWGTLVLNEIKAVLIGIYEAILFVFFGDFLSHIFLFFENITITYQGFFSFILSFIVIVRVLLICNWIYKCYKNRKIIKLNILEIYQIIKDKDNRKDLKLKILEFYKTIIHKGIPELKIKAIIFLLLIGLPIFMLLSFGLVLNLINFYF